MKQLLTFATVISLSLANILPVSAATIADPLASQIQADIAAKQMRISSYTASAQYQEYTGAQRMEASIQEVMRLNNINHEEATKRYMAAIISQSGAVGVNPLAPNSWMAFNPAYQAWMDGMGSFYAGYDPVNGRHQMTSERRVTVNLDNMWYCRTGQNLIYGDTNSTCQ